MISQLFLVTENKLGTLRYAVRTGALGPTGIGFGGRRNRVREFPPRFIEESPR